MLKGKDKSAPSPTFMSEDQMARYLSDLRQTRPVRPSGARPPPSSRFSSTRRAEPDAVVRVKQTGNEQPVLSSSNSMPLMTGSKITQRRTESDLGKRSSLSAISPFAGRPLARAPPSSTTESDIDTAGHQAVRRTPSMTYIENGMRWMEKQEVKSLREALNDMDLEEERKIHAAAQDEAAELVWKHTHPEAAHASKVFANPDLPKNYRSHLRKGSYQKNHSQDTTAPSEEQRSASDGSQHSNSDGSMSSSGNRRTSSDKLRKVSPPSGVVSVPKRRESGRKSQDQLAEVVARDIAAAYRRTSSGSRRILSGEKKMFMHPDDRIWEDPQEEESPPRKQPDVEEERERDVHAAAVVPALPSSHLRKNPFARVRAHYHHHDRMDHRANSAPTISTLPPAAPPMKHERVEIQRNAPSQSRNPWYLSNEPLPPTPPPGETGHDADEVAPKTTPTKDGREIRGDDIRAATSKTRKDYSPNLPRPTVVSDKPGRPIVSFQTDWAPKEIPMEEKQVASEAPAMTTTTSTTEQRRSKPSPSTMPRRSMNESATHTPNSRMSMSRQPAVPIIVMPDEEDDFSQTDRAAAITIDTPSISVSGPHDAPAVAAAAAAAVPPRDSNASARPPPAAGRPLPRHANTAPVSSHAKSTPHYTPSIRQSGALCAHCALPIAGRILSAAGERFHPGCFVCHQCGTNLECVAFYPEPDKQRAERGERIRTRHRGGHGASSGMAASSSSSSEEAAWQEAAEDGDDENAARFYCHLDFHELFSPRCKSCKTPIEGEVIVACGAEWHVGHFFCAQCGDPFDSATPFVEKDGYAWCVGCHTNRYSSKCRKCKKPVTDVVVKALGADWHSGCFVCTECNGGFDDGRYFLRGESQDPVCVKCEERRLKA